MKRLKRLTLLLLLITHASLSLGQQGFEKKLFITQKNDTLPYQILLPKDFDPHKKYPLVLFLHGAGERGKDNEKQMVHGSSLFLSEENRTNFPAIVIFPQCPQENYWANMEADRSVRPYTLKFDYTKPLRAPLLSCVALVKHFIKEGSVDKSRVYVMGLSMGGMGTFELISRYPKLFAAAIPICGGGDLTFLKKVKKTPVWMFHGELDDAVGVNNSREIYALLKPINPHVKYTEYPAVKHDSWTNAFAEPELLKWLFSWRKGK